jgi:hypothetical protein
MFGCVLAPTGGDMTHLAARFRHVCTSAHAADENAGLVTRLSKLGQPLVTTAASVGGVLGGWLLVDLVHRFRVRTGVSNEEAFGSLPGDEIIRTR